MVIEKIEQNTTETPQTSSAEQAVKVNKKGFIEVNGEVLELLPAACFKVCLENGQEIIAHLSGKMRMNRILLLVGDRVKLEMSPYDLSKGRVVYRY